MDTIETKKPDETLEQYLIRGYEIILGGYKKLVLVMVECDVNDVYQFRAGLERVTKSSMEDLEKRACQFWGSAEVRAASRNIPSGWSLMQELKKFGEDEAKKKLIEDIRATCNAENPANQHNTPVEILKISPRLMSLLKQKPGCEFICHVLWYSDKDWLRTRGFTKRDLKSLNKALATIGHSLKESSF